METNKLNKTIYYENLHVAIYKCKPFYLEKLPFNPHLFNPGNIFQNEISSMPNPVYEAV